MGLRLGVAAAMAAILATLSVMIVRAVIDPPHIPDIAARDAFLLQHVVIGLIGGIALQFGYRRHGLPGNARSLRWGLIGFVAAVLAPLWSQPSQPPGVIPTEDGAALLFWLFTVAMTASGLWLLIAGAGRKRLLGLALVAVPPLLAPASAWREQTGIAGDTLPGDALPGDALPDAPALLPAGLMEVAAAENAIMLLGLNLLFWLLLGAFSVLSARRLMDR